jgi:hypothetical protein
LFVLVDHRNMKTQKDTSSYKSWVCGLKVEFCMTLKYSCGIALFVKQVPLQSCVLVFLFTQPLDVDIRIHHER